MKIVNKIPFLRCFSLSVGWCPHLSPQGLELSPPSWALSAFHITLPVSLCHSHLNFCPSSPSPSPWPYLACILCLVCFSCLFCNGGSAQIFFHGEAVLQTHLNNSLPSAYNSAGCHFRTQPLCFAELGEQCSQRSVIVTLDLRTST